MLVQLSDSKYSIFSANNSADLYSYLILTQIPAWLELPVQIYTSQILAICLNLEFLDKSKCAWLSAAYIKKIKFIDLKPNAALIVVDLFYFI